ncbi:IMP cyclohydrolase [Methanobrevibacter cuticularis]|uniref:IMP cyclohydrolase n=1 Tax=Methanobrevibacter cuticularis TaxID=47311 RepID=A0A166DEB1_9EURY|nr:IMP cyclohydrolase [Methanobrevibacter cuticularis]KZX15504.1 IMP cyclohydrolase [Methanobrevibacter cuticularis]
MYLGRIVSVGMNKEKKPFIAYRVSSRSFPNRMAKSFEDKAAIIPKEGYEKDIFENAYIAYNCVKVVNDVAIVSNGSHTDVIADKIAIGMNIKDALSLSLLAMDYEKDDYNTPRIAGVITSNTDESNYECYIGIITDSKLLVEKVKYGAATFISTYECQSPEKVSFTATNSKEAAKLILDEGEFKKFTNPVASVGSIFNGQWTIESINL